MITERLYFADPYLTHFSGRILERADRDGRPAVALIHQRNRPVCRGVTLPGSQIRRIPIR